MEEIFEMCRNEGPKGEKGSLDVSKMKPSKLKKKAKEAEDIAVAADSMIALEFATSLASMREALKKALNSGNVKATDPEWIKVEKALTKTMSCHAKLSEPVSEEELTTVRSVVVREYITFLREYINRISQTMSLVFIYPFIDIARTLAHSRIVLSNINTETSKHSNRYEEISHFVHR